MKYDDYDIIDVTNCAMMQQINLRLTTTH